MGSGELSGHCREESDGKHLCVRVSMSEYVRASVPSCVHECFETGSLCVTPAGLEFPVFLLQPSQCWNSWSILSQSPYRVSVFLLLETGSQVAQAGIELAV